MTAQTWENVSPDSADIPIERKTASDLFLAPSYTISMLREVLRGRTVRTEMTARVLPYPLTKLSVYYHRAISEPRKPL